MPLSKDAPTRFCIRKRIVVLKESSFGLNEMPLPTSMFGMFASCSLISSSTSVFTHLRKFEVSLPSGTAPFAPMPFVRTNAVAAIIVVNVFFMFVSMQFFAALLWAKIV